MPRLKKEQVIKYNDTVCFPRSLFLMLSKKSGHAAIATCRYEYINVIIAPLVIIMRTLKAQLSVNRDDANWPL